MAFFQIDPEEGEWTCSGGRQWLLCLSVWSGLRTRRRQSPRTIRSVSLEIWPRLTARRSTIAGAASGGSQSTVVTCNNATKYRRDADNTWVTFADLKVGQTLRVYYTASNNIATLVNIAQPGSK